LQEGMFAEPSPRFIGGERALGPDSCDRRMPRNNKNSAEGNSNQFKLLDIEEDGTDDNTVGSTSGQRDPNEARVRPLKQPYDPESPPRKKSVPTKTKATKTVIDR